MSASATGYYGDRPGEELDENSGPGTGFFLELVTAWETAAAIAGARRASCMRDPPLSSRAAAG
ncbi:MAG: hypothetical protein R2717_09380 [Schumannella sp.]